MTTIALAMQKGGVGKTTTTLALGVELSKLGARVLLVDIDPQSNLAHVHVQQLNPTLTIGGIAVTMRDRRTSVNQVVEDAARQQYGDLVFKTVIPFNIKLVEAPAAGQPISIYAPGSTGLLSSSRRRPLLVLGPGSRWGDEGDEGSTLSFGGMAPVRGSRRAALPAHTGLCDHPHFGDRQRHMDVLE